MVHKISLFMDRFHGVIYSYIKSRRDCATIEIVENIINIYTHSKLVYLLTLSASAVRENKTFCDNSS